MDGGCQGLADVTVFHTARTLLGNVQRCHAIAFSQGGKVKNMGKFHRPDNSLLSFCSSPFRVEVQCQPQRGGTDRHEIHETAGY